MHRSSRSLGFIAVVAIIGATLTAASARAEVLTFDSQPVGAFSGPAVEGSFVYRTLSGSLVVRTLFVPTPPIMMSSVSGTGAGTLSIQRQDLPGGRFVFERTDVMPYKDIREKAVFSGWLDGALVATDVFTGTESLEFASRSAVHLAGAEIDELRVALDVETLAGLAPEFIAVDNLALRPVAAVPEPSTQALILAGLAGLGWIARRRRS